MGNFFCGGSEQEKEEEEARKEAAAEAARKIQEEQARRNWEAEAARRILEEQARRNWEAEAARRAQELARARALKELEEKLTDEIDFYIRTRRAFDSRDPLSYKCSVASVQQSPDVCEALDQYNEYWNPGYTLRQFMSQVSADHFALQVLGAEVLVGVKVLTPFQGENSHRVFGYFKCGGCKRQWHSASTWRNKWQKCQQCDSKCYPFQQHPLLKSEDDGETETRRPHDMSRCQKCQELGKICVPHMYYAVRR